MVLLKSLGSSDLYPNVGYHGFGTHRGLFFCFIVVCFGIVKDIVHQNKYRRQTFHLQNGCGVIDLVIDAINNHRRKIGRKSSNWSNECLKIIHQMKGAWSNIMEGKVKVVLQNGLNEMAQMYWTKCIDSIVENWWGNYNDVNWKINVYGNSNDNVKKLEQ